MKCCSLNFSYWVGHSSKMDCGFSLGVIYCEHSLVVINYGMNLAEYVCAKDAVEGREVDGCDPKRKFWPGLTFQC